MKRAISCVRPASMRRRIKSSDPVMLVRSAPNAALERDEQGIADLRDEPAGRSLSLDLQPVMATAAAL